MNVCMKDAIKPSPAGKPLKNTKEYIPEKDRIYGNI